MDTGTHIVMGVALGGLATLDPVVASDPVLFNTVMIGTIMGSLAPDIDTVLKLKDNATYIRHHRGITHSIPAVILWGILISGLLYFFVPDINFLHLWLWTFLAVGLHVFVDLFNAYGTQALRPFTDKWIAFGFINTFDPYIFFLHIAGILAWALGAEPGKLWLVIYGVIVLYYIKRYTDKRDIVRTIEEAFPNAEKIVTFPTLKQNNWRVSLATPDNLYVGWVADGHIQIVDQFDRLPIPNHPLFNLAVKDPNISAFLSFSPIYHWEMTEYEDYMEVRFIDLRYRSKGRYAFVAIAKIDHDMNINSSFTGWVFSEWKLQDKLQVTR